MLLPHAPRESLPLLRRAASLNYPPSLHHLATLYESGTHLPRQLDQAALHYTRAALHGHVPAKHALSRLYRKGLGVQKDPPRAVALLQDAIRAGHLDACVDLADCYLQGVGVEKNETMAVALLRRAVDEAGNAVAKVKLAECLKKGSGVDQPDIHRAFQTLKAAAEENEKGAFAPLGMCYEKGQGVPVDLDKAFEWYFKAAQTGNAKAMLIVGSFLWDGEFVRKDRKRAVGWFQRAIEAGESARGRIALADALFETNGEEKAIAELYKDAMEEGVPEGYLGLAECYFDGRGVEHDSTKGVFLIEKAISLGSEEAKLILANRYFEGAGVKRDAKKAVTNFKKAMEGGSVEARLKYANCLYFGDGIPRDYTNAVKEYQIVVEKGSAEGAVRLGHCYMKGTGVTADPTQACQLYEQARSHGSEEAKLSLAHCYMQGKGCLQNLPHARNLLLQLSEDNNNAVATRYLAQIYAEGHGVSKSFERAAELFRKASDLGDNTSTRLLAAYYRLGRGVSRNPEMAFKLYKKAGDGGDTIALENVAWCYKHGYGVERSKVQAVLNYEEAFRRGNHKVEARLVKAYSAAIGNTEIDARAVTFLQNRYTLGNKRAGLRLAFRYYSGIGVARDHAKAVEILKDILEDRRSGTAMELLALCYLEGYTEKKTELARHLLTSAQELGHKTAKMHLALCIIKGLIPGTDPKEGLQMMEKAAEEGCEKACIMLGDFHYRGHFLAADGKTPCLPSATDYGKAVEYYQKAPKNAKAQYRLFMCYKQGQWQEASPEKAVDYLLRSARQEYPHAQSSACPFYEAGTCGVVQQPKKAMRYYQSAIAHMKGIRRGRTMYNYGLFLSTVGPEVHGIRSAEELDEKLRYLFQEAANQNIGPAANDLAVLMERRVDLNNEDDDEESHATSEAFSQFLEAAENNVVIAQSNVGVCYEMGIGTCRDPIKARHYYERAVLSGNAVAENNLALMLVEQEDYDRVLPLLRTADGRGDSNAAVNLGVLFERGVGIDKDPEKAFAYYTKASDLGNIDGMFNLGSCYEHGVGTSESTELAKEQYRAAASKGHVRARDRLQTLEGIGA